MKLRSKKTYLSLSILALVAIISFIFWIFIPKGYEHLVPAEAKAVLRIEPVRLQKQLAETNQLTNIFGISTEGIDMEKAIYAFVTPNEYIGLVAAVNDKDALKKQFDNLINKRNATAIEEIDGRPWVWLTSGWLATWDSNSLLILGPGIASERDLLRQTMERMMENNEPFVNTDRFRHLKEQGGDAQLFAQLNALPSPYNMLFRLSTPPTCDPSLIEVFASATLTRKADGLVSATIKSELSSENEDILQSINLFEKSKGYINSPSNTSADSTLFVMATCVKGKSLLELLRTDATLRGLLMGLNQTIDADKMIGSTDGMFNIEISALDKDFTPTFCIKAETHASDLMADADYWLESASKQKNVKLVRQSPNSYSLSNDKQTLNFGLIAESNMLYFSSANMQSTAIKPFIFTKSSAKQGLLTYFRINTRTLMAQPCIKGSAVASLLKILFSNSQSVTYQSTTGRKATLVIE